MFPELAQLPSQESCMDMAPESLDCFWAVLLLRPGGRKGLHHKIALF